MRKVQKIPRKSPDVVFWNVEFLGPVTSEDQEGNRQVKRRSLGKKMIVLDKNCKESWGIAFRHAEGPQKDADKLVFTEVLAPKPSLEAVTVEDFERNSDDLR